MGLSSGPEMGLIIAMCLAEFCYWGVIFPRPHPSILVSSILTNEHTAIEGPSPHSVPEFLPHYHSPQSDSQGIPPTSEESSRAFSDNCNVADPGQGPSPPSSRRKWCLEIHVQGPWVAHILQSLMSPLYSDPKGSFQIETLRLFLSLKILTPRH